LRGRGRPVPIACRTPGASTPHTPARVDDGRNRAYNPTTTPAATKHRAGPARFKRRDTLVNRHIHLAGRIAREIASSLPARFELEDLEAAGRLGLLHAAERYRPRAHGGTPFEAFARVWIRGAILSAVRREWCDGEGGHAVKPLTESLEGEDLTGAAVYEAGAMDGAIDAARRTQTIQAAVKTLPAAQREVLRAVYSPGPDKAARSVRGAAAELGMPASRAYRLHNSGINALRARLA
jgi:RNA polymerase sigma factor (sigma-70 family)